MSIQWGFENPTGPTGDSPDGPDPPRRYRQPMSPQERIQVLEYENQVLREQNQHYQGQIERLSTQIRNDQRRIRRLRTERDEYINLWNDLSVRDAQSEAVYIRLERQNEMLQVLRADNDYFRSEAETLRARVADLENKTASFGQEIWRLQGDRATLQELLADRDRQIQNLLRDSSSEPDPDEHHPAPEIDEPYVRESHLFPDSDSETF